MSGVAGPVPDDPTLRVMASEFAISEGACKARETGDSGPVPDDVIEAVARQLFIDYGGNDAGPWDDAGDRRWKRKWREQAMLAFSVPSVAAVFARDAKVREIVDEPFLTDGYRVNAIAALYSEDGAQ